MAAFSDDILLALGDAAPTGLGRVADRRWVGEAVGGIRRMLEFTALKGDQYSARWGFSVDFVPQLKGERLAWKRTPATAAFDLAIDPVDVEAHVPTWCSFNRDVRIGRVRKVARAVRAQASLDFDRVDTLQDLLKLFEQRETMRFVRFGPENYVQTDLARGLLQLATGDSQGAADRIRAFCDRFGVDPETPILAKAKQEALRRRDG